MAWCVRAGCGALRPNQPSSTTSRRPRAPVSRGVRADPGLRARRRRASGSAWTPWWSCFTRLACGWPLRQWRQGIAARSNAFGWPSRRCASWAAPWKSTRRPPNPAGSPAWLQLSPGLHGRAAPQGLPGARVVPGESDRRTCHGALRAYGPSAVRLRGAGEPSTHSLSANLNSEGRCPSSRRSTTATAPGPTQRAHRQSLACQLRWGETMLPTAAGLPAAQAPMDCCCQPRGGC